jgi:HlyD family secretion protein
VVAALNAQGTQESATFKLRQAESEANHAVAMRTAAAAALASARAQRDSLSSNLEQAIAHQQKARIDLERTEIRSPVDGTVVWKSVDVGQTVSTNVEPPTLFFIAQDLTEVQVETTIDENDVSELRVGQPVSFTVAAYSGELFQGSVKQIRTGSEALFGSRAGSASAVTYIIEIATANKDRRLLPGMTASVRIVTASAKNSLTIPAAALRYGETIVARNNVRMPDIPGTRPLVLIAADNSLRIIAVKPLASDGITTAIYTGASIASSERAIVTERRGRDE